MKKSQQNSLMKKCPHCGSDNISFQLMQKEVPGSKINGLFIGPVLFTDSKKVDEVTYALCNNCGNSWVHQNRNEEIRQKKRKAKKRIIIFAVVALVIVAACIEFYFMAKYRH
ncbi:MAG: hypothetical protein IJ861_00335 [Clostridia bacterium]|nr:hypothetical protein [Clostridia bacterium]